LKRSGSEELLKEFITKEEEVLSLIFPRDSSTLHRLYRNQIWYLDILFSNDLVNDKWFVMLWYLNILDIEIVFYIYNRLWNVDVVKNWVSRFLLWRSNSGLDVCIGKTVCNEKCMHDLGKDFFLLFYLIKEWIFSSIRLVLGSSPGQPI